MQEPLLLADEEEACGRVKDSSGCPRGVWAGVCSAVHDWWVTTTDSDYLQSRISRRPFRKVAVPAVCFVPLVTDAADANAWLVLVDTGCVITSMVFFVWLQISPNTILLDAAFTLVILAFTAFSMLTFYFDPHEAPLYSHPAAALGFPLLMCFLSCLGFHSITILLTWLLGAILCGVVEPQGFVLVASTVLAISFTGLEYLLATLYREQQMLASCNQKLLDSATDGFGVVDSSNGVILEASPKMMRTLGNDAVVGRELKSMVDAIDHETLARVFFGKDARDATPAKVMVTCISSQWQFEARLVPYHLQGTRIAFCVQQVGEARHRHAGGTVRFGTARLAHSTDIAADSEGVDLVHLQAPPAQLQLQQTPQEEFVRDIPCLGRVGVPPAKSLGTLSLSQWTVDTCECESVADETTARVAANSTAPAPEADSAAQEETPTYPAEAAESSVAARAAVEMVGSVQMAAAAAAAAPSPPATTEEVEVAVAAAAAAGGRVKKVETRTLGVKWEPTATTPPAPLAASSAPAPVQAKALRRRKLARACRSTVDEGVPRLAGFVATPKSTRGNCLFQLVLGSNVSGKGCCPKHVAWMALQAVITEELLSHCGNLPFCSDWQCPECRALNNFDSDADDDEKQLEQGCAVCGELVEPILALSQVPGGQGPRPSTPEAEIHDSATAGSASGELDLRHETAASEGRSE